MTYTDSSDDDSSPYIDDETESLDFMHDMGISQSAQNRVLSVDPNEGRCLIENCPNPLLVDFCHCYPRKLMSDGSLIGILTIGKVSGTLHVLHDRDDWMLLPGHDIIEQYHQALIHKDGKWIATRESFPNIPNRNDFEYTFLPVSNAMKKIAVHRQDRIPPPGVAITREDVTTHVYPFDTMPVFKSHLHPKYVILEAGRKLNLLSTTSNSEITTRYPILIKITQIVQAWTSPRPSDAMNDSSYHSVRVDENGFVINYLDDENSDGYDSTSDAQTQPIRFGFQKRLSREGANGYRRGSFTSETPHKRVRAV